MNTKIKIDFLIAFALAVSLGGVASAEVVLQEGFEGYTAGVSPNPSGDLDPGTPPVGSAWTVTEPYPANVQVWTGSSPPAHSGSNYISLKRASADSTVQAMVGHVSPGDKEILIYDVYVYNPNGGGIAYVGARHNDPWKVVSDVRLKQDGLVYACSSGWAENNTGLTYTKGQWELVTITMDMFTDTYTVQINGGVESSPYTFIHDEVPGIDRFNLGTQPGYGYYVDDMEASVSLSSLAGDLNGDWYVDEGDLEVLRDYWGQTYPADPRADPSGDGLVSGFDLDIVRTHWGEGTPPVTSTIPEPATVVMLLMGTLMYALGCVFDGAYHTRCG